MAKVELQVVMNADDAFLIWRAGRIDGCLGFAIQREWHRRAHPSLAPAGPAGPAGPEYLLNRVGFQAEPSMAANPRKPSTEWPFQRYNWTDHDIGAGDRVRYRVIPMTGSAGTLSPRDDLASPWVDAVAAQPDGTLRFYFNRPMAASRWMARVAQGRGFANGTALVNAMGDTGEDRLRGFCGGTLILGLRELFAHAQRNAAVELYAALFELRDDEAIDAFAALKSRAHVVLADGAAKDGGPDLNADARERLRKAGCDVTDRMTASASGSGSLAHNKFIVVQENGTPRQVWTGSTNLTTTGLFTQINNAVLIDAPPLAAQYLAQWHRLAAAGSALPRTLKKTNAAPAAGTDAPSRIEPWFTPTVEEADLDRLRTLVEQARDGILFLSFMPGPDGPVLDILRKRAQGMYVRGVLNQFVGGAAGKLQAALVSGRNSDPFDLQVVTPTGIKEQLDFWSEEFVRGGSLSVLVHSKVICIDPFGARPVVVTGSHNFSKSASASNDENFLVIEGNGPLARAYAAHIMSTYNHYRWREYVKDAGAAGRTVWQKLENTPDWQDSRLASKNQQQEWAFWLARTTPAGAPTP